MNNTDTIIKIYKSVNNFVVTLLLDTNTPNNLNRADVIDENFASYKCKQATVLEICHKDDQELTKKSISSLSYLYIKIYKIV